MLSDPASMLPLARQSTLIGACFPYRSGLADCCMSAMSSDPEPASAPAAVWQTRFPLEDYEDGGRIGEGSFGTVREAGQAS